MNDIDDRRRVAARRHVRFGWIALLAFGTLGLVLESLHGFKAGWYLDATNETRRHMLTLSHTHGTLLALVNLVWATAGAPRARNVRRMEAASSALRAATILLPGGFLLGSLRIHGGDPGMGIVLVPVGAVALLYAIVSTIGNLDDDVTE